MLSLRNVEVKRDDFTLGVEDLVIREGETIAVMGISGSGKTTLLEVLSGLEMAEGQIDNDIDMSYGFQNPYLQFFTEKVSSEILFGRRKMDSREAEKLVEKALSEFLLPAYYCNKSPYELSGGEARRVLLSALTSEEKPYLFLDECLSGLDEEGEVCLRRLIERRREMHKTTIFTSHDPEFSILADRLLILKEGRLIYDGSPRKVLSSTKEASLYGLKPTLYASLAEDMGLGNILTGKELVDAILERKEALSEN